MSIRIADFARWQLRLTLQDLKKKKRGNQAAQFVQQVRQVLSSRVILEELANPMSGLPELPFLEVVVNDYRLYFRNVDGTLWLAGLWPPLYDERLSSGRSR